MEFKVLYFFIMTEKEALNLMIVACISADNCMTIDECNHNIEILEKLKTELPTLEFLTEEDFKFYNDKIQQGILINLDEIREHAQNTVK